MSISYRKGGGVVGNYVKDCAVKEKEDLKPIGIRVFDYILFE